MSPKKNFYLRHRNISNTLNVRSLTAGNNGAALNLNTSLSPLEVAEAIAYDRNPVINQPFHTYQIQQRLLQDIPQNHIISWISHLTNEFQEFGLSGEINNSPAFVTGSLRANVDYLIDNMRSQSASHVSFSSGTAKMAGYQAVLATIRNPQLPEIHKNRLATALVNQVNNTLDSLNNGANKLSTAIRRMSASSGLDMSTIESASNTLLTQTSSILDQINTLDISFSHADVSVFLDEGLKAVSKTLKNTDLIQQSVQTVGKFMLGQLTSIPMAQLSQFDDHIISLTNQLNDLKNVKFPDQASISNVANQLKTMLENKLSLNALVQDPLNTLSDIGGFISTVGDVIGVPVLKQVGKVVTSVVKIANGISALLNPALGAMACAFPVGTIAAIAASVGQFISSFFGSSGPSELEQVSQQIGQLSEQMNQMGVALGNQISALGEYNAGRFDRLDESISQVNKNIQLGFSQLNENILRQFNNLQINLQSLIQNTNKLITMRFDDLVQHLDTQDQRMMQQFMQTQGQVNAVKSLAEAIDRKMDTLTSIISNGFQELYNQQYEQLQVQVIQYYQNQIYGTVPPLNPTAVRQALLSLVNWVSVDTKNPIFHGDLARDYSLSALATIPEDDVSSYVNLLKGILSTTYHLPTNIKNLPINITRPFVSSINSPCTIDSDNQRFINPRIWSNQVTALMQFITQTPELSLTSGDRCLIQKMVQSGEDFLGFILNLKTNSALFNQLIADYKNSLDTLIVAIYKNMVTTLQLRPDDVWTSFQALDLGPTQTQNLIIVLNGLSQMIDPTCGSEHIIRGVNLRAAAIANNGVQYDACIHCKSPSPAYPTGQCGPYLTGNNEIVRASISCNTVATNYNGLIRQYNSIRRPYATPASYNVSKTLSIQSLAPSYCNNYASVIKLDQVITHLNFITSSMNINLYSPSFHSNLTDQQWLFQLQNSTKVYQEKQNFIIIDITELFNLFDSVTTCPQFQWNQFQWDLSYASKNYIVYANGGNSGVIACNMNCDLFPSDQLPPIWQVANELFTSFQLNYQQVKNAYHSMDAMNHNVQSTQTKISQAIDLQTDKLFYSSNNVTELSAKVLPIILQWLEKNSTTETRQQIQQAILDDIQNAGTFKALTEDLTARRHALIVFLSLAFSDEFDLDPLLKQQVFTLWTGEQFIQNLQANPANPNNFIIAQLQTQFFSTTRNQPIPFITAMELYLDQATKRGNELYNNHTLDSGYWAFSTVLRQLRDLRDYIYPQSLSSLEVTPKIIAAAYAENAIATITAIDNMLFNYDTIDTEGNSAIMLAVKNCDLTTVLHLLVKKVNINLLNTDGNSVLNLAMNCQDPHQRTKMFSVLLQSGAEYCQATYSLTNEINALSYFLPAAANLSCLALPLATDIYRLVNFTLIPTENLSLSSTHYPSPAPTTKPITLSPTSSERASDSNTQTLSDNSLAKIILGTSITSLFIAGIVGVTTVYCLRKNGNPPALTAKKRINNAEQAMAHITAGLAFLNAPKANAHSNILLLAPNNTTASPICFFQWDNIFQGFLPITNYFKNSPAESTLLIRQCMPSEHIITGHLFSDSQWTFSEKQSKKFAFDLTIGEHDKIFLRQSAHNFTNGCITSAINTFTTTSLRHYGLNEEKTQCATHLIHCAILYKLYGSFAVFMHLATMTLNDKHLGFKDSTIRLASLFISAAIIASSLEKFDYKNILCFGFQMSSTYIGSKLGTSIGKKLGENASSLFFLSKTTQQTPLSKETQNKSSGVLLIPKKTFS